MESENIVLGKINKKKVYLNDGKYGHYLTYETKNYKVPEWFPVDKIDIDIAERLIEYKKKMSELFLTDSKKPIKKNKLPNEIIENEKRLNLVKKNKQNKDNRYIINPPILSVGML